jgi:hypothetical protein
MAPFGKSFEKTRDRLGERLRQLTVYLSDPLEEKEREYIVKELLRAAKKNGEKIQDLGQKRQKKDTADQSCFQLRCEGIKTLLRQESEYIQRRRTYNWFYTAIVVQSFALHINCLVMENNSSSEGGRPAVAFHNVLFHDGFCELEWVIPKNDPSRGGFQHQHDVSWNVRHQLWRGLPSTVPTCKCYRCSKLRAQRSYPIIEHLIDRVFKNKIRAT